LATAAAEDVLTDVLVTGKLKAKGLHISLRLKEASCAAHV
jgi:hypothetical protein